MSNSPAVPAGSGTGSGRRIESDSSQPSSPRKQEKKPPAQKPEAEQDARPNFATGLLKTVFGYLGEVMILLGQTLRSLRNGVHLGDLLRQINIIGVETVPIAILTIGFTGAVLALYSVDTLTDYGASDLIGGIVALSIAREIGPILSGVVVAARAGSAMTAEIGSMKVTEQVDALRAMGISPIEYLIVPRVIASIIIMPMLTLAANVAGVVGGGIVAANLGVSFAIYFNSVRQLLDPSGRDIIQGLLKTMVFGILIVLVGCREGLNTEGGAAGVGSSTTRSVVLAIILVFIANFLLSYTLFRPEGA